MLLSFAKHFGTALLLLVSATFLLPEWAPAQQGTPGSWCVLRRHNVYEPPNCFEFYLCDTLKDVQRCGLAPGGACGVGQLGLKEGWGTDPNAHPPLTPGPFMTWEGADMMMTALQRMGGNFYACNGPRTMELPRRVAVSDGPSQPGFCVLRKPIFGWPPNCFEFYLAVAGGGRAVIQGNNCMVTSLAARENWAVDPNQGGPYINRGDAQAAHSRLNPYGGNFYGCPPGSPGGGGPTPPSGPPVRDGASEPGFCVLRKPIPTSPPNCYEFYLAVAGQERAVIQGGVCFVTSLAVRENWIIDPTAGGPYAARSQAQAAHDRLNPYYGNFYNCPMESPPKPRPDGGGGSGGQGEQGSFRGGLDPTVVDPKVQSRRKEGITATFTSGTITLTISPDGRASITRSVTFEGRFVNSKNETYLWKADYTLSDGNGRDGRYSGKLSVVSQTYWSILPPNQQWKTFPKGEYTWSAVRQKDGSYVLSFPNGHPPSWGDIPYVLR